MKKICLGFILLGFALGINPVFATSILNLNVFDQLQGNWESDFREKRMKVLSAWIRTKNPDIIVFQEAQADDATSSDTNDSAFIRDLYPYRKYVHEMMGKDGKSYGYWIGAKKAPSAEWSDGFFFPGGVDRKTAAGIWLDAGGESCIGVLTLHLSYQNSNVRQKESQWIKDWIKLHEADCKHWIVTGDFNADKQDKEISLLFDAGFKSLVTDLKPTVGPFNPIRRIYGEHIKNQTIDWALGWNINAKAEIVFDQALDGVWLSDHAGILMDIGSPLTP